MKLTAKTQNGITKISIEAIQKNTRANDTQIRRKVNPAVISEYADLKADGVEFPPIDVFFDGEQYWLADGFHRLGAEIKLGYEETFARVHSGGYREAIIYAMTANNAHGLKMNNADKRAIVHKILSEPIFADLSLRELAKLCNVSHTFIAAVKADIEAGSTDEDGEENSGDGEGYTDKNGVEITGQLVPIWKHSEALKESFIVMKKELKSLTQARKELGEEIENEGDDGDALKFFANSIDRYLVPLGKMLKNFEDEVLPVETVQDGRFYKTQSDIQRENATEKKRVKQVKEMQEKFGVSISANRKSDAKTQKIAEDKPKKSRFAPPDITEEENAELTESDLNLEDILEPNES